MGSQIPSACTLDWLQGMTALSSKYRRFVYEEIGMAPKPMIELMVNAPHMALKHLGHVVEILSPGIVRVAFF